MATWWSHVQSQPRAGEALAEPNMDAGPGLLGKGLWGVCQGFIEHRALAELPL